MTFLEWVYIRIRVQETRVLEQSLMDFILELKIGAKFKNWVLKSWGAFSWLKTNKIWQKSDALLALVQVVTLCTHTLV